jgi:hypothetical protein
MRQIVKWIGLILVVIVVLITAIKLIDYNSLVSQNTRQIKESLAQNLENGNVRNLISFSYDGFNINLPSGEYTKAQIDNMTYEVEKREVGNSYGTPKTYMHFKFFQDKKTLL